jgi:hypothetical protein
MLAHTLHQRSDRLHDGVNVSWSFPALHGGRDRPAFLMTQHDHKRHRQVFHRVFQAAQPGWPDDVSGSTDEK